MDPTDIVVESLLKAASTEVVKRGIDAISTRLRAVFDRGNHEEIKKVVEEENLGTPLAELAKQSLDSSYIIPFSAPQEARPRHKVDFFLHVLQFGFKLSVENKVDIIVPGSFVGTGNLSLFSTVRSYPAIAKQELAIFFPDPSSGGYYSIIPAADRSTKIFDDYLDMVQKLRNETEGYVEAGKILGEYNWNYSLTRLSAGTAYFRYGNIWPQPQKEAIGIRDGSASILSWSDGIRSMLNHAAKYPDLGILPQEDVVNLLALAEEIKGFAARKH